MCIIRRVYKMDLTVYLTELHIDNLLVEIIMSGYARSLHSSK